MTLRESEKRRKMKSWWERERGWCVLLLRHLRLRLQSSSVYCVVFCSLRGMGLYLWCGVMCGVVLCWIVVWCGVVCCVVVLPFDRMGGSQEHTAFWQTRWKMKERERESETRQRKKTFCPRRPPPLPSFSAPNPTRFLILFCTLPPRSATLVVANRCLRRTRWKWWKRSESTTLGVRLEKGHLERFLSCLCLSLWPWALSSPCLVSYLSLVLCPPRSLIRVCCHECMHPYRRCHPTSGQIRS